ncbi:MAG: hypothetical protein ACK5OX_07025, partial [Desertimonas sp.]
MPIATLAALATAIAAVSGVSGAAAPATTPPDEEEVVYDLDAVIDVTNDGAVQNIDPHQEPTQGNTAYWTPLYDTLTDITVSGEVRPRLAESWEYSEDGLSLVFHLRD